MAEPNINKTEPTFREKFKHILMTGESLANEQRKAEIKPKIDLADKAYRFVLLFFFLLFWVIAIWRYFA
ncbi:MAG: hypothetical protein J6I65_04870 [Lachnospiraceae bacterium]|nr:hypothetical protein [Lachnospiraceae bacterium]